MLLVVCCALMTLAVGVSVSWGATPLIIAHRGASADAPENTLAAFRLAWEQGADGIEGDFRLTADGRIVCIHDEDTQRVAGTNHLVATTTWAELRALDVGRWKGERWQSERIPTLEDVLHVIPEGKLIFIELKTGPEIVEPLVEVLTAGPLADSQIVLIAFDSETVAECKRRLPRVKCHWLTTYDERDGTWTPTAEEVIAAIRHTGAEGLGSANKPARVEDAFVQKLRHAGINEFHVWTVDDPTEARHYARLGAWALTTNRPGALRRALESDEDIPQRHRGHGTEK